MKKNKIDLYYSNYNFYNEFSNLEDENGLYENKETGDVRLPSDNLSEKEIENLSGKCVTIHSGVN